MSPSIGFLDDTQRMNVALTRAKYSLLVVGNEPSLRKSVVRDFWFARGGPLTLRASSCVANPSCVCGFVLLVENGIPLLE